MNRVSPFGCEWVTKIKALPDLAGCPTCLGTPPASGRDTAVRDYIRDTLQPYYNQLVPLSEPYAC